MASTHNDSSKSQDEEIKFLLTPTVEAAIQAVVLNSSNPFLAVHPSAQGQSGTAACITLQQLQDLSSLFRKLPFEKRRLLSGLCGNGFVHELARGSEVYSPKPAAWQKTKTPEFERHLQQLKNKQSKEEADRMMGNGGTKKQSGQMKMFSEDMALGVHIIVLMLTGFVVFWYCAKRFTDDKTMHVVSGLVGLVGAMLLETTLWFLRQEKRDIKARACAAAQ